MGLSTTPRTWVAGETVTAALLNTEIRDALTGIQAYWAVYAPTLLATTTNPTLGTGSYASGIYIQIGKTVIGEMVIIFGTSGTAAGSGSYLVTMPVAMHSADFSVGEGRVVCAGLHTEVYAEYNTATTVYMRYSSARVNGTSNNVTNTTPGAWAINDVVRLKFRYMVA